MLTEERTAVLNNPIWNALTSTRAEFSQGGSMARRFLPEIGPLAGIRDQSAEAYAELGGLLGRSDFVVLFLNEAPRIPAGWTMLLHKPGVQMVYTGPPVSPSNGVDAIESGVAIEALGERDIPEMLALAKLTEPGPFRERTIDLGGFVGIRVGGRLAAMAGERLRWPGYTEVSGVCTHPDFRRRGYAQALIRAVIRRIEARGETPMLHAFASNASAIRVYEAMGYELRLELEVAVIRLADQPA